MAADDQSGHDHHDGLGLCLLHQVYPVGRERVLTHDTRHSLVINHQATSPELVRDPSVSVGGELGQDVFDPNAQVCIGLLPEDGHLSPDRLAFFSYRGQ